MTSAKTTRLLYCIVLYWSRFVNQIDKPLMSCRTEKNSTTGIELFDSSFCLLYFAGIEWDEEEITHNYWVYAPNSMNHSA